MVLPTHYYERSDFLITTLPATDEAALASTEDRFFPQIADGSNYTIQLILFNGRPGASVGTLLLFSPDGGPLEIPLQ